MITIARFSKPEDAHLLRLRLGTGDVPAYVLDENIVQLDWLYSNAIGGVRVQIFEDDLDAAREVLDLPPLTEELADILVCPKCASANIAPDEFPRRFAFSTMLVLGFPIPFCRVHWICADCHHVWRLPKGNEASGHP